MDSERFIVTRRVVAKFHCIRINVLRTSLVCLTLVATAVADGSFLGQVLKAPTAEPGKKWVYIQGPHGSMRRVDISGAKIAFSSSIEKKDRNAKPEDAIREGAEVRVTASQDGQGEWKASVVEIVKAAPK